MDFLFSCPYTTTFVAVVLSVLIFQRVFTKGQKISGAVVVITGASQGIGAALAKQLGKKNAKVVILARGKENLEKVKEEIEKNGGTVLAIPTDCSSQKEVENAAEIIEKKFGVPNIIVNNAGAGRWRFLHEVDEKELWENLSAPYMAAALLSRQFTPGMINRGSGVIVNVLSPAAIMPWAGATGYCVGRWALRGLSASLESDLFSTGVKVQDVYLGETKSEYFSNNPNSHERIPSLSKFLPVLTVEQAASAIVAAIENGRRIVAYPRLLEVLVDLTFWCPSVVHYVTSLCSYRIQNTLNKK